MFINDKRPQGLGSLHGVKHITLKEPANRLLFHWNGSASHTRHETA